MTTQTTESQATTSTTKSPKARKAPRKPDLPPITAATKLELRGVKYAAFASEETSCFKATIYIDGKKSGWAENDGHGGATRIDPYALAERIEAYAKTLPAVESDLPDHTDPSKKFTYQPTAETIIDDLLSTVLLERDLKKSLAKRVLFTVAGSCSIFQTKEAPAATLATWLSNPAHLRTQLKADRVLNALPFAEALAIYRKSTQTPPSAHAPVDNDYAMAKAGHHLRFKHEDSVDGVDVGPVWWVASTGNRIGDFREGKDGAPAWVPVNAVHRIAKAIGVKVEEV